MMSLMLAIASNRVTAFLYSNSKPSKLGKIKNIWRTKVQVHIFGDKPRETSWLSEKGSHREFVFLSPTRIL